MKDHFYNLAKTYQINLNLKPTDVVLDIGSNDGTFLEGFDIPQRVGVEPSKQQALCSLRKNIPTYPEFFSSELARRIEDSFGKFKLITASNVFAHLDNLYDFMAGVKRLLTPDGVFIVEVHNAENLINQMEWDSIYHEHLSYFTPGPLLMLGHIFNLPLIDVQEIPVHGGSLRLYFSSVGKSSWMPITPLNVEAFSFKVKENKNQLLSLLARIKQDGKKIVGYGCPAKASTLTNYCGIGTQYLDYIIDTTPAKQGKFSPGQHIPIVSPDQFKTDNPDYALMFAWNYKDEILAKEKDWLSAGGKFIIPIPYPEVVG
jgi:SAM-dependent methyltransferase